MMDEHTSQRMARASLLCRAATVGMITAMQQLPEGQDIEAIDVCNGALTLANHMIIVILEMSRPEDIEHNRAALKDAVMKMLMTTTTGEAPKG